MGNDLLVKVREKRLSTIDLFLKLLSGKSVTPNDDGLLDYIEDYLSNFESVWINKEGVKNLFLTKKFGKGKHLCFAGHIDVVPSGDEWDTNPFVPVIKDGYVYGRGTQDMKSGVTAFVQAVRDMKENFSGRISIILTSDEEGDGEYGTKIVMEYLKKINLLPDFCILAEPTSEKIFGDTIKIGRRGSINGYLTLKGKQGHAGYPAKAINPIHQIAPILPKLAGYDFDNGDENFESSKLVITNINAGFGVENVTPDKLEMMFNIRNSTKTTKEDIKNHIDRLCKGLDYKLELKQNAYPFITDRDSYIVKLLKDIILDVTGIETKFSTAGGTSDGRFISSYGIEMVEFGVINNRMHAKNERTTIEEVETLYDIFVKIMEQF